MPGAELRGQVGGAGAKVKGRAEDILEHGKEFVAVQRANLEKAVEAGRQAAAQKREELRTKVSAEA
jgi:hypothetical protein